MPVPFLIASKKTKYLQAYLTKAMKDFYAENCEEWMREI